MSFAQFVGHEKQILALRSGLATERLHHAYLFVGPEGVGKRTIAVAVAKAIHCSHRGDDFCDRCANCARIADGNHPDVRLIQLLAGKKEISIQQVREIERELNFRSFSGGKKIVIVDPATLMTLPAQNALLKTLEEPPRDSLLILIGDNAGSLLPTLRSRCLRLSFGPLTPGAVADFLTTVKGMKKEQSDLVSALAMGSIGTALEMDSEELREDRRAWLDRLSSVKPGDYRAALEKAEALAGDRDELLKFLQWAEQWYRDRLVYAVSQQAEYVINRDLVSWLEGESAHDNLEHMVSCYDRTAKAVAQIRRNLNRRMVMEDLLLTLAGRR